MTKIKICGLTRQADIDAVNKYLPDYIGFVFVPESKRYISFETAKLLKTKLNPKIKVVGVFINEPIENIPDFLDIIQLHGEETQEYITELKNKIKKPVIALAKNKTQADYILFDNEQGGSGKTFDWNLIETARLCFLAGGLNASNVEKAIKKLNPFCVDISSGVETNGIKDEKKIKEIIEIVRGIK